MSDPFLRPCPPAECFFLTTSVRALKQPDHHPLASLPLRCGVWLSLPWNGPRGSARRCHRPRPLRGRVSLPRLGAPAALRPLAALRPPAVLQPGSEGQGQIDAGKHGAAPAAVVGAWPGSPAGSAQRTSCVEPAGGRRTAPEAQHFPAGPVCAASRHHPRPVPRCWAEESFTATSLLWPDGPRAALVVKSRLCWGLGSPWL